MRKDVNFIYILHGSESGFVTHKKLSDNIVASEQTNHFVSVYGNAISAWREALRINDSDSILVAFAWCSNEEMRLARMFPEYWACDTTFGATKEQRNLFLFAGVDGENKTFPLLYCFMPSKLIRAYTWAIKFASLLY